MPLLLSYYEVKRRKSGMAIIAKRLTSAYIKPWLINSRFIIFLLLSVDIAFSVAAIWMQGLLSIPGMWRWGRCIVLLLPI